MATSISRRANGDSPRVGAQNVRAASLSEQLKKMVRHPLVILSCVIIGALLGALVGATATPKYQATSTVLATPISSDPNALASNQMTLKIETEAGVAGSREVAEAAAKEIDPNDSDLVSKLRHNVEVAPHSGTEVMDITATADNPDDAARYANAIAEAYLQVRSDAAKQRVEDTAAEAQNQLNKLPNNAPDAARSALEEKLAQVKLTNTEAGRVISVAQSPKNAGNLGVLKDALIGAIAGLLLGLLLAWLFDSRSRKLGYQDRAEEAVNEQVFTVRSASDVEDARRVLFALGAPAGRYEGSDLAGTVVYSPEAGVAEEFAQTLRGAMTQKNVLFTDSMDSVLSEEHAISVVAQQPTVVVADQHDGISNVLAAANHLGSAIIVLTPSTMTAEATEFSHLAENNSNARIAYVYLAS